MNSLYEFFNDRRLSVTATLILSGIKTLIAAIGIRVDAIRYTWT